MKREEEEEEEEAAAKAAGGDVRLGFSRCRCGFAQATTRAKVWQKRALTWRVPAAR